LSKIVSTKVNALFLATVLLLGTIAAFYPSFMVGTAQAQSYYNDGGMDNNYEKSYGKDVSVKSIKCNNINANVNGLELDSLPPFLTSLISDGEGGEGQYGGDNSYESYGKDRPLGSHTDFKFICINNNNNIVVLEEEPPVPQTASLTVNKEIYGCNTSPGSPVMLCDLQGDSPAWISCDDPAISNTVFCQRLTEDLFDIEVLDDQNNQIEQFEGSVEGTTIENLEPGIYTVNEIVHTTPFLNQLNQHIAIQNICIDAGFDGGGALSVSGQPIIYEICFEYEDEQGNDCSTITLAAGEERTCTVKNYIRIGVQL
jgi:hypothetical protein